MTRVAVRKCLLSELQAPTCSRTTSCVQHPLASACAAAVPDGLQTASALSEDSSGPAGTPAQGRPCWRERMKLGELLLQRAALQKVRSRPELAGPLVVCSSSAPGVIACLLAVAELVSCASRIRPSAPKGLCRNSTSGAAAVQELGELEATVNGNAQREVGETESTIAADSLKGACQALSWQARAACLQPSGSCTASQHTAASWCVAGTI